MWSSPPAFAALLVFKDYLIFFLKSVTKKLPIPTPKSAPAKPSIRFMLNFKINFNNSIRIPNNINMPEIINHFFLVIVLVFNWS